MGIPKLLPFASTEDFENETSCKTIFEYIRTLDSVLVTYISVYFFDLWPRLQVIPIDKTKYSVHLRKGIFIRKTRVKQNQRLWVTFALERVHLLKQQRNKDNLAGDMTSFQRWNDVKSLNVEKVENGNCIDSILQRRNNFDVKKSTLIQRGNKVHRFMLIQRLWNHVGPTVVNIHW